MEVLLNSIWLAVAIGAFLLWYEERTPEHRDHSDGYRVLALTCASVLLFPVISLTDDLHAEQTAMEESSRSVMKAQNIVQECLRAGTSSFPAVLTNASHPAAAVPMHSPGIIPVVTPVFRLLLISAQEGRSPPSGGHAFPIGCA